jgi:competence protein ComEA
MSPRLRGALSGATARAIASPFAKPIARAAGVAAGLVLLALLGRSATGAPVPFATSASSLPATATATATATPTATPTALSTPAPRAGAPASPDDPVILNTATADDLRRLPGIGEKRADAILALRARLGRFRAVEDLLKVKGIGRATLRRLRPLVRLDPPPRGDAGVPTAPGQ